jgi:hypothetical protein
MSRTAASVFYFGLYIALLGGLLVAVPNLLLGLVSIPPTNEVWIRLTGMLLIILGFFYAQAARHEIKEFFKWTLVTRSLAGFFVIAFVLTGMASPVIVLFWLGDVAGICWTIWALKADGK